MGISLSQDNKIVYINDYDQGVSALDVSIPNVRNNNNYIIFKDNYNKNIVKKVYTV